MMGNRTLYLDVIRIIACLMVIMMHSPAPLAEGEYSPMLGIVSLLMQPCNGLFFMASGALLFGKGLPFQTFLRKRLPRIVYPVIFWSIVYIAVDMLFFGVATNDSLIQLAWVPFCKTTANSTFWFMYTLLGCYFLVPIVEPWLLKSSKKELEYVICLWIIVLILPLLTVYLGIPAFNHQSAWYYFGGFFGYFLIGWYVSTYEVSWKKVFGAYFVALVFLVVRQIQQPLNLNLDCYLHPFTVFYCFALFVTIKKLVSENISEGKKKVLYSLSACTFGVYLIHVLVLTKWLKNVDFINSLSIESAICVRWILTAVICFCVIFVLRKIPFSKYLIG